jgi:hypothetical protein
VRTRTVLLLALAGVLALCATTAHPTFGGFVGSASSDVSLSVDSLANHVTVTTPTAPGTLQLHNPTSAAQSLELTVAGAPAGVSASFHSSGTDQVTLPAGASDAVDLSGPGGTTVHVTIASVDAHGALFPSSTFPVQL